MTHKIAPCLWFDDQAEDAAHFYTSIFKDSKIGDPDAEKSQRAFQAMLQMKKLDIAALEKAFAG